MDFGFVFFISVDTIWFSTVQEWGLKWEASKMHGTAIIVGVQRSQGCAHDRFGNSSGAQMDIKFLLEAVWADFFENRAGPAQRLNVIFGPQASGLFGI